MKIILKYLSVVVFAFIVSISINGAQAGQVGAKKMNPLKVELSQATAYVKDLGEVGTPNKKIMRLFIGSKPLDPQLLRGVGANTFQIYEMEITTGLIFEFDPDNLTELASITEIFKSKNVAGPMVISGLPANRYIKNLVVTKEMVTGVLTYKSENQPINLQEKLFKIPVFIEKPITKVLIGEELKKSPQLQLLREVSKWGQSGNLSEVRKRVSKKKNIWITYLLKSIDEKSLANNVSTPENRIAIFTKLYIRSDLAHLVAIGPNGSSMKMDFTFEDGAWKLF